MESETGRRLFNRLRQLREERNLTQEALAERANVKYKHYQAIEAGRKPDLRISTLEKLAKGLGLEPWELLIPAGLSTAGESAGKYRRSPNRRPKKK